MNRILSLVAIALTTLASAQLVAAVEKSPVFKGQWPAWRGPSGTGAAPSGHPPVEWSADKNIRWKAAIPGRGLASPIVWGDRVYLLTAVETKKDAPPDPNEKKADKDAGPQGGDGDGPRPRRRRPRDGDGSGNGGGDGSGGDRPPPPPGDMPSNMIQPQGGGQPDGPPDQPPPPRRRGPGGPGGRRGGGMFGPREKPKHIFEFQVIALDRKTGKIIWTKTVKEERPHEAGHPDASQVSNSPVTDGEHIYAFFGSRGLYCLTMDGEVKWSKDLGKMKTRNEFGEGSSPALYGDTLVINWDHEGDDFIVAFDKHTGKELWRNPRDEHTNWSTPLVVDVDGKPQVVVSATNFIRAYDLKTGKEVWRCKGMTESVIPSPMAADGLLYAISGFKGAALLAIKYADANGDVTGSPAIAWSYDKDTPYVPSALLYNGHLYFLQNTQPLLTCLDAKTGKPVFAKQRLEGLKMVYSSLVGADGHVYITGRSGATMVLKDGPELKVIATNKLDDDFEASPAIAGNELYLRGKSTLYCIAEK